VGPETTMVMSAARHRALLALLGAAVGASAVFVAPATRAQVPPLVPSSTTTTAPPSSSPPPSEPSGSDFSQGASEAPDGAPDAQGDGAAPPAGGIDVPAEAQRIISSVRRTGPSDNAGLLTSLVELQELGLPEPEAFRVGLGRFPIAGPARYSHDWLFPRYGPGFRFHLGTDVFAAYGTPVRAPVDGVVRSANGGLGGLSVKVVMPDGTYFYLAHLSGLAQGFVDGMAVSTGDVVGFVGDSGNARGGAPHLHIGIYPHGGPPIDPKPILDQFLAEAQARVPAVVDAYRRSQPAAVDAADGERVPISEERRVLRPMLATGLLHGLAAGSRAWPVELLYLAGSSAVTGPRVLIDLAIADIVDGIDWEARAIEP
jgi:murein DD-endopeptidase MepM/ murein hydrolase activator NlpD